MIINAHSGPTSRNTCRHLFIDSYASKSFSDQHLHPLKESHKNRFFQRVKVLVTERFRGIRIDKQVATGVATCWATVSIYDHFFPSKSKVQQVDNIAACKKLLEENNHLHALRNSYIRNASDVLLKTTYQIDYDAKVKDEEAAREKDLLTAQQAAKTQAEKTRMNVEEVIECFYRALSSEF